MTEHTKMVLAEFTDIGEAEYPIANLDILCDDSHIVRVIDAQTGELIFDKDIGEVGNGFDRLKIYLERC